MDPLEPEIPRARLLSPEGPQHRACIEWLVRWLAREPFGRALVEGDPDRPRLCWNRLGLATNRALAAEAWTGLGTAGLLPAGWQESPRRFRELVVCPSCGGSARLLGGVRMVAPEVA